MKTVKLGSRKITPSKIICVGRNYTKHIQELGNKEPEEIVLFIKPNSSISDKIVKPPYRCRYEGEISFIIENGEISGVGFGIDLTLIDIQNRLKNKGLPWEKAKAFDGSAVFSQFKKISTSQIKDLSMELYINGKLKQKGSVSQMINTPEEVLKEAKKYFSLHNGDIIMCGTPSGVGEFEKGDIFTGRIYIGKKLLIEKRWTVK